MREYYTSNSTKINPSYFKHTLTKYLTTFEGYS